MRVSRRFRFTESKSLELLIEGFNLFNRTQVTGETATFYNVSTASVSSCTAAHTTCQITINGVTQTVPFSSATNTGTLTFNTGFQGITAAGGTLFRERQVQWAVRFQF
jgi:hypothetical protein